MSDTSNDMVVFLMPDGSEVSNDPRFGLPEALQKQLDSVPYSGDAGTPADEVDAQHQITSPATMNSGVPGVGENATPDDVVTDAYGPLGSPAQQQQTEDMQKAKEAGATPFSTSVEDKDPVDSNDAVLAARKARQEALNAYSKAQERLAANDENEGDPDVPLSEWTGKQLQAEVAKRNTDGRSEEDFLKIKSGMKKADVVKMLEEDNERQGTPEGDSEGDSENNESNDDEN